MGHFARDCRMRGKGKGRDGDPPRRYELEEAWGDGSDRRRTYLEVILNTE